jgi:[ribosomal protein S5]-alanine N-acetyltransferase
MAAPGCEDAKRFMTQFPTIDTERLVLGRFEDAEAPELQRLAGAREIADTTLVIPHPYELTDAEQFIALQREGAAEGNELIFAIHRRGDARLVGSIALREIDPDHLQAELGYWIGVPYWGQGYATEAARAVVNLGFEQLGLNRIYAHHMARNPASGRVLERIGMRCEGLLRQRVRKWGRFEDVVIYSRLRDDPASPALA